MRVGRSTTRRRLLVLLALFNGIVLYLNFKVLTIDDIRNYSEELSSNLKKLRLLESTYMEQWSAASNQSEKGEQEFVWEKVENLHLALPAYEKMRHILSRLQDFQFLFSRRVNQLGISQEMLTYKSILWRGNVERLKDIFVDVLQTNRSIKIGVLAGAISGQTICPERECLYIDHIRHWMEKILQTTVTVHNAAIPYASSDYFAWCKEPHLDVDNMDIIIWELATEDYTMRSHNDKQRYDHAAQPQELLTRQLKALPSKPFLMFVNFMPPESIRNRDCVNSEYYAGRHICRHYNITSVSWCAAVCQSLWQLGFTPDELIHSGDLLSERAHEQAGFFVINFLKGVLKLVAVRHMNLARSDKAYLQKLVSLHDVFIANSKVKTTSESTGMQRQQPAFNAIWKRDTEIKSTNTSAIVQNETNVINKNGPMQVMTSSAESIKTTKPTSLSLNGIHEGLIKQERFLNKRSRFPARWIHNPVCWPLSQPQFVPNHLLALSRNDGWEEGISDYENWYTSTSAQKILEFKFEISPSAANQTCVVALAVMACDYCGQALAWLDQDFDRAVLVGGKWAGHAFRVIEIMKDVTPGKHTLSLKSLEEKPFKLSAVMTAHKDKTKF